MKKRLMALFLCLIMVLSVALVGCGKKKDAEAGISEDASKSSRSLTMWVVSEKKVDADTAATVTSALNTITRSKFKVNLVVNYLTQDEYRQILTETIRANEDARNYLLSNAVDAETSAETGPVAEETETNKYGVPTIKYPALKPNQVDIIYIDGYDMYTEYINNNWLLSLDSELSAASKKIKEYISATLLSAAKVNGATYAIPNNSTIGEYTYMLLDKNLMEETFMDGVYKQGKINGMFNEYIFSYLETVRKHHAEDAIPVAASYDDCLGLLAHYWSINPETFEAEKNVFSFLGYRYTDPATLSKGQTVLSFNSLFADEVFCENYEKLNEYRLDGNYFYDGDLTGEKKAAIRFCKGDLADYEMYLQESSEYYPVIVKYPSVDIDDVYASMFGVCKYSVDTSRSMQIITYLTSNADFRNILQYGVKDVHYTTVQKNGATVVERLNENYMMDVFKTGNAFLAYLEPTMNENIWEIGKKQNLQAKIEPLLSFDFAQIAQNSGASSSSSTSSSTYQYSFSTGYSKDVLAENERLSKWFSACDAAGEGVYVLHTSLLSGQTNLAGKIYYYNNHITNAKVSMSDDAGKKEISVNYSGTPGNGYEITVIDFAGKKNQSMLNWKAAVNGADVATNVTYQNSILNFDFFHTKHYCADLTVGLTKAAVYDNEAIRAWLEGCTEVGTYDATFVKSENGKDIYTYVFYENGKGSATVTLQPTGDYGTLNLAINYSASADAKQYTLFLLTVEADAGMKVNFNLMQNGSALEIGTSTVLKEDPMFRRCGQLDTELVNYVYKINGKVLEIIGACETVADLHAVIADLHILFTPASAQPFTDYITNVKAALSTDAVKALADSLDLDEFYWRLHCATSNSAVTYKVLDEKGSAVDIKTHPDVEGESVVYYSSPYMLYYAWLKSNGFLK